METSGIYILENFLTDQECTEFVNFIKNKINKDPHRDRNISYKGKQKTSRYNSFHTDNSVSDKLWKKLENRLQKKRFENVVNFRHAKYRKMYSPCALSNKLTTAYYYHGEIPLHQDKKNNLSGMETLFTLLIYLNDDFEKGRTIFYPNNKI